MEPYHEYFEESEILKWEAEIESEKNKRVFKPKGFASSEFDWQMTKDDDFHKARWVLLEDPVTHKEYRFLLKDKYIGWSTLEKYNFDLKYPWVFTLFICELKAKFPIQTSIYDESLRERLFLAPQDILPMLIFPEEKLRHGLKYAVKYIRKAI